MKWKAWALIVLVGAAILAALLVPGEREISGEREPSYLGHRLSWWVEEYGHSYPGERDPKVVEALSKIGTNAIPFLFTWMRSTYDIKSSEGELRAARARAAAGVFSVLGTNARPAIPELGRMVNEPTNYFDYDLATVALCGIGNEGLPALAAALANPKTPDRTGLVWRMSLSFHTNPAVVPVFAKCLQDTDNKLREQVALALGSMVLAPEVAVPALADCLKDAPPPPLRRRLFRTLAAFGPQGRAAIPVLVTRLNDPDLEARTDATNALQRIAPEVLTNSPAPQPVPL
ncbi:MAG: HEAT repeat domain-containing protein [Verrucomicrobiota bacterium]